MIDISPEDSFRLNILFTQDVKAIRINESRMTLHALTADKEASIQLHPQGNEERYLRQIKELLASHYMDSPEAFPVFMSRWTRMQQSGKQNLDALLKIGEPEAVVYAVNSPHLSEEQASYAWWVSPSTEIAVELVKKPVIARSKLAQELKDFLLEFLPFENEPLLIINAVHLLLANELLSDEQKQSLVSKGQRKAHYLIGMLHCDPEVLPGDHRPSPLYKKYTESLVNPDRTQAQLQRFLSAPGQNYLNLLNHALNKFTDQESIIALFQIMQKIFSLENLTESSDTEGDEALKSKLESLSYLSQIHENLLNEPLSRTNAVGSVLRKQLRDVCQPISLHIENLLT